MSSLKISVQPEEFSDWEGLHALLVDCFAYMEGRVDPPSSLMSMTPETLRQKAKEEILIIAHQSSQLVACGFLRDDTDFLYLGKIAVKARFRKMGILRSIVEIAEKTAHERGKLGLELETRVELTENQKIFQSLGFSITASTAHKGYDRPTAVTMRKLNRSPPAGGKG